MHARQRKDDCICQFKNLTLNPLHIFLEINVSKSIHPRWISNQGSFKYFRNFDIAPNETLDITPHSLDIPLRYILSINDILVRSNQFELKPLWDVAGDEFSTCYYILNNKILKNPDKLLELSSQLTSFPIENKSKVKIEVYLDYYSREACRGTGNTTIKIIKIDPESIQYANTSVQHEGYYYYLKRIISRANKKYHHDQDLKLVTGYSGYCIADSGIKKISFKASQKEIEKNAGTMSILAKFSSSRFSLFQDRNIISQIAAYTKDLEIYDETEAMKVAQSACLKYEAFALQHENKNCEDVLEIFSKGVRKW